MSEKNLPDGMTVAELKRVLLDVPDNYTIAVSRFATEICLLAFDPEGKEPLNIYIILKERKNES